MRKNLFFIVLLISYNLHAQFFPILELPEIKKEAEIDKLNIEVEIIGNIAETTVDMTFFNPNDRIMEGTLKFPLTSSQEIVEFHLDINGKLRKTSVVEKEKGRVAYEATIRQNIDPGLLEKSIDNSFKARVFPIPAKGYKRAVFKIQEELKLYENNYKYTLPFKSDYAIPEFSLKATIFTDKEPQSIKTLDLIKWQDTFSLNFSKKNYKLNKEIFFKIPKQDRNIWVKNSFFYTSIDITDLYKVKQTREVPKPTEVTILWDTSASSDSRDKELEYKFLKKYFKELNKISKIKIVPFNIESYKPRDFKAVEVDNIIKYLKSLKNDGGTRLKNLNLNNIIADRIMMFTDGVSTFEKVTSPTLPQIPIYTITSSYNSNSSLLNYYAIKTGGEYINLLAEDEKIEKPKLLEINTEGIAEVYSDIEITGNQLSLAGKISKGNGEIKLTFLKADGTQVNKVIQIVNNETKTGIDIERLWALKKIKTLDLLYDLNWEEITEIGKEFSIATRNTSLIVLDRVEDYVRFDITPPDELINEWDKLMSIKLKQKKKTAYDNLSESLNEMGALKSWWLKDFPKDRPQPPKEPLRGIEEDEVFGSVADSATNTRARESMIAQDLSPEMEMSKEKKIAGHDHLIESITVEGWTPDTPYFKELSKLKGKELLSKYYNLRNQYKNRPSFFVDVATLFYESGDIDNALLIISNVVEMDLDEPELLRVTIYLLEKFGFIKEALEISFKLLKIRADEPQTYRDIASLSLLNHKYQQALEYYYKILTGSWDSRFNGVKSVVLNEMNFLITNFGKELNLESIDNRLIFDMPVEVRAVISWSSNNNDIDLWVKDPYEEDCGYSNKLTHTGGKLSSDFTGGYGPEEFTIKNALYGLYIVDINFYSDNRMSVAGPVTIKIELYKNYGNKNEVTKETIIRRLKDVQERITIGSINF